MSAPSNTPRLVTPRAHGGALFVPSVDDMFRALAANQRIWTADPPTILGRSLVHYRRSARRQILAAARAFAQAKGLSLPAACADLDAPLIVTGHQCQFFHGGILIKYLLANHLAAAAGGFALNLAVDNDAAKSAQLRLPVSHDGALAVASLPIAPLLPEHATEQQPAPTASDLALFESQLQQLPLALDLTDRLSTILATLHQAAASAESLGEFFALLNNRLIASLDRPYYDITVSRMCATEAFTAFLADMLQRHDQARSAYAQALTAYRRRHHIRNHIHPMADLAGSDHGGSQEMPFWLFRPSGPRAGLFLRRTAAAFLLGDGHDELLELPLGLLDDPAALQARLSAAGLLIRPKALTLTAFARLFLADYFIHGIGGARYDQVTDDFIRRFYRCDPPAFAAASATLYLPFEPMPTPAQLTAERAALRHRQRDLHFNPQRYLSPQQQAAEPIAALLARRRHAVARSEHLRTTPRLPRGPPRRLPADSRP